MFDSTIYPVVTWLRDLWSLVVRALWAAFMLYLVMMTLAVITGAGVSVWFFDYTDGESYFNVAFFTIAAAGAVNAWWHGWSE